MVRNNWESAFLDCGDIILADWMRVKLQVSICCPIVWQAVAEEGTSIDEPCLHVVRDNVEKQNTYPFNLNGIHLGLC